MLIMRNSVRVEYFCSWIIQLGLSLVRQTASA